MRKRFLSVGMLACLITGQGSGTVEAAEIWSEPSKTEVWTEGWNTKTNTQPAVTKNQSEKQKPKLNVNDFIGKWKLWIPGGVTSYYYVGSGNYAGSKYNSGASTGVLTINKNGTYVFNKQRGSGELQNRVKFTEWRVLLFY